MKHCGIALIQLDTLTAPETNSRTYLLCGPIEERYDVQVSPRFEARGNARGICRCIQATAYDSTQTWSTPMIVDTNVPCRRTSLKLGNVSKLGNMSALGHGVVAQEVT